MSDRPVVRAYVEYKFRPEDAILTWGRQGSPLNYQIHPACQNISREARSVEFEIVDLGFTHSDYDRIVRELDTLGLRPAISSEMKAFYNMHEMSGHLWDSHMLAAAGDWILEGQTAKFSFCFEHDPDSGWPHLFWCCGFGFRDMSKVVYARFLAVKKEA